MAPVFLKGKLLSAERYATTNSASSFRSCLSTSLLLKYISCFYAVWYLQADDVVKAPYLDLTAIQQMHQYREVSDKPEAVDHVIANMFKHTWYLDSTLVPLALLDSEVPNVEKREIADAILAIKMPHKDRSEYKPDDKEEVSIKKLLQFDDKELPSMAPLINKFSFYIFSLLGFEEERLRDWLVLPPEFWHTQSYFKKFSQFAEQLVVTNDHCERAAGMMQRFVHRYSEEENKQNLLKTVDMTRHALKERGKPSHQSKKRLQTSLSALKKKTSK